MTSVVSLLLALAACDNASVRERAEAARQAREAIAISPERARINGLGIGASETEVIAAFGPPARIEEHGFDEIEGKLARTINYDGIEIYLVGGEIFNLECRSRICATADGIRVGDSAEKVLAVMGPGRRFQRDDGTEVLHYPITGADVALIVDLNGGTVVALTLFFDYV